MTPGRGSGAAPPGTGSGAGAPRDGSGAPPARRWLRLEPGEAAPVALSCAYFFCLLSSYYLVRPVRDALGVSGGTDALTWLYMGTLTGTLVANPVFGALVARFPRRVFVPVVYHVLAGSYLLFWLALTRLTHDAQVAAGRGFFIWLSVFNVFATSVFWGFMADVWRKEQGKRLFALIAAGGTLGAVCGSFAAGRLAGRIGPFTLLLVAAVLLEVAVVAVVRLGRRARAREAERGDERDAPPPQPFLRGALAGLRLSLTSPVLAAFGFFVACYGISSTFLYFEQARIVREVLPDAAARATYFADVDLWVNVLSLAIQVFAGGRIMTAAGVGASLAVMPALTLGGFGAIAAAPGLAALAVVQVARRVAEYALVRPARETVFTTLGREEKYTAKSFLDTFVFRGADALGAWGDRLLALAGGGPVTLAVVFVPLGAAWLTSGLFLGRRTEGARAPA